MIAPVANAGKDLYGESTRAEERGSKREGAKEGGKEEWREG
jgi:hypothetical protein